MCIYILHNYIYIIYYTKFNLYYTITDFRKGLEKIICTINKKINVNIV